MEVEVSVNLKRKFEEVDGSSLCSSPKESDDDVSSSDSADSCDSLNSPSSRELRRRCLKHLNGAAPHLCIAALACLVF